MGHARRTRVDGRALALALAVALAAPLAGARADETEAARLEASLRDWLANLLGSAAALGARPVRVTPEGDRFAIEVPIAGPVDGTEVVLAGPPLSARATPLPGGRWALDALRLPSPLAITAPSARGANRWTITMREQDQHAVIDPSLTTTSTWDGRIGGYAAHWQGPGGTRDSEAEHMRLHLAWQPAAAGRIDISETASSDLIASNARLENLGLVSFSAAHAQTVAHIDRLAPDEVPPLLHAAFALAPLLQRAAGDAAAPPGKPRLSPALRTALGNLLDATGDLLGGFGERATLENVHLHADKLDAAMQRLEFAAEAGAPDGRLRLRLHLGADGFDSGALPKPPLRAYVPRHISLTTRIGGVSAERTLALLRDAVASDGKDPALAGEALSLLRNGPLDIGIDEVAADFGPATLAASGALHVAGPDQVTGQAHVRATGLDALLHDAQSVPMLQAMVPALIFLKGIGATEGNATVWNIVYSGARVTVNGTDLSQLMAPKRK